MLGAHSSGASPYEYQALVISQGRRNSDISVRIQIKISFPSHRTLTWTPKVCRPESVAVTGAHVLQDYRGCFGAQG